MKNEFYYFVLFLILFMNIGQINTRLYKGKKDPYLYHPLRIKFDFSNIPNLQENELIISLLNEGKDILSNLILSNNINAININLNPKSKCKGKYSIAPLSNPEEVDILILPVITKMHFNFTTKFCSIHRNRMPSIIVLNINKNLNLVLEDKNSRYFHLLKILKVLTDCLGLDVNYIKKLSLRNNFLETPYYLMYDSNSFQSFKKLYTLSGRKMPIKNINIYGHFYLSRWPKNYLVKDFKNEKFDINADISETSMNLFNDIKFYKVSPCEFEFVGKNRKKKCYSINQKCYSKTELNKYYLTYAINADNNNEVICYLSNSYNIKNNQCGIKYGKLLSEDKLDFCPLITKEKIYQRAKKNYQIPDLIYNNKQTLTLLKPSPKCKKSPRTIYFKSVERDEKELNKKLKLQKVTLKRNQKDYFVTYLTENEVYFKHFVEILNKNGIIRSYYHNNNHNLFLKGFNKGSLKKLNKNCDYFNEYQILYHYMGVEVYFYKNILYQDYSYMRSFFKQSYNYMPITYEYPKDKEEIEKKFKNYKLNLNDLWIVKPINLCSGIGIHIFQSLEEEKKLGRSKYLISKYLSNPHLINGKKYDMRLYVLISGFEPLRIYLNNEGLIRIAADKYTLNKKTIQNKYAHLTNTAINVHNKKYKNPKKLIDEKANKWNLLTYRNYLKRNKMNVKAIFGKIEDIIIKTVIAGQRHIIKTSKELNLNDRNMFNVLGFDIILDNSSVPHLLEVNTRPYMKDYNKYDRIIKSNLFVDTLNIVGISPFSHKKNYKSYDEDLYYKNEAEKKVDRAYCELTRPRGDYKLIFPLKSNIETYRQFFFENVSIENQLFWEEIKKHK